MIKYFLDIWNTVFPKFSKKYIHVYNVELFLILGKIMEKQKAEPEKEWESQAVSSKSTFSPEIANLNTYIPRQNLCTKLISKVSR